MLSAIAALLAEISFVMAALLAETDPDIAALPAETLFVMVALSASTDPDIVARL